MLWLTMMYDFYNKTIYRLILSLDFSHFNRTFVRLEIHRRYEIFSTNCLVCQRLRVIFYVDGKTSIFYVKAILTEKITDKIHENAKKFEKMVF